MKKHFHITLHFTVETDETKIPSGEDEWHRIFNARQKRLLQALLSNENALQAYALCQIASHLECYMYDANCWLTDFFGHAIEDEEVLQPIIATLSKEDQQWFSEVQQDQIFYENTEPFQNSFSTELEGIDIVEVKMRDRG